jgi:ornithine cyclodeaminase/alanine dehydrogenase-like protein (mu-crystallin family)
MLYLTEDDVTRLIDMPTVLGVVERAFLGMARGEAENVPRMRAQTRGITLHTMSAAASYLGFSGWKNYTTTAQGARFLVGLHENATGRLVALLEANRLGQVRTGAATGVAVRHLSHLDVDEIGLFGTGWQAESQLAAVAAVRPLRRAVVYSRSAERREAFARKMSERLMLDVSPAAAPREAVERLPLIVTATTSVTPVFDGEWLMDGAVVAAVGSNWLNKAELDASVFRRAVRVVCDDVAACRHEAGDLAMAAAAGAFAWERAESLAAVVAAGAAAEGRSSADSANGQRPGMVVFKSVGLAIEDLAVAVHLVGQAQSQRIGIVLPVEEGLRGLPPMRV